MKPIRFKDQAGFPRVRFENGKVARGYLDGAQVFHGIPFAGPVAFHPDGKLKLAQTNRSVSIGGLVVSGWLQFNEGGRLESGRLESTATRGGLTFQSGQYVDLAEDGSPMGGFGGEAVRANKAGTWQENGFLKLPVPGPGEPSHPAPLEWICDGFGCSVWPVGFCFGSHGGSPFAEWGRSVALRDFIYGEDMGFVDQYFAAEKEAILERARLVHRTISMIEIIDFMGDGRQGSIKGSSMP